MTGKSEISGHLFCPECQEMFGKDEVIEKEGVHLCPEHDVGLIDVDEIAVKSAKEPKDEYCIACHPINEKLWKRHVRAEATVEDTSLENCLICHESHSKCGGCHF